MSERKVLNKYYPPDFDPTKIPKLKRPKNRQFNIRIMAPFNMRCGTCGEYIYKGKKFNSRQEKVENEDYLGLMIFRFYIKCPRCVSEISFKTDPQNCDYELEAGATRNFEALRTAEKLAEAEIKEKEEEEKNNPMKVLENRTKASRQEMEMLETLDELRELNSRNARLDHDSVLKLHAAYEEQLQRLQAEEDEEVIRSIFGTSSNGESIKRIHDEDGDDDVSLSTGTTPKISRLSMNPSDLLIEDTEIKMNDSSTASNIKAEACSSSANKPVHKKPTASWQKSVGGLSSKSSLVGLVKKKMSSSSSTKDNSKSESKNSEKESQKVEITSEEKQGITSEEKQASKTPSCPEPVTSSTSEKSTKKMEPVGAEVISKPASGSLSTEKPVSLATGLGMLGAYSDSDSDTSNG